MQAQAKFRHASLAGAHVIKRFEIYYEFFFDFLALYRGFKCCEMTICLRFNYDDEQYIQCGPQECPNGTWFHIWSVSTLMPKTCQNNGTAALNAGRTVQILHVQTHKGRGHGQVLQP